MVRTLLSWQIIRFNPSQRQVDALCWIITTKYGSTVRDGCFRRSTNVTTHDDVVANDATANDAVTCNVATHDAATYDAAANAITNVAANDATT